MDRKQVSQAMLGRLPLYLGYLKSLPKDGPANISATSIANALNMGEVRVRKDLASVCDGGKPKIGYITSGLIDDLEIFLGYRNVEDAIIVGAGKLGLALLGYDGFKPYGLNIVAAFDTDPDRIGQSVGGKEIFPLSKLEDICRRLHIRLGMITVPAKEAQGVCDRMIGSGILAMMNFTPTHLKVPEGILLHHENIASSLALLSKNLTEKLNGR